MSHHDHLNKIRECIMRSFEAEEEFHATMADVTEGQERDEHLAQAAVCRRWREHGAGLPSATRH